MYVVTQVRQQRKDSILVPRLSAAEPIEKQGKTSPLRITNRLGADIDKSRKSGQSESARILERNTGLLLFSQTGTAVS